LTPKNFDGYTWDNIENFIFDNNVIQEIKIKLIEITGLIDISDTPDDRFIEIIFGDIRDKNNLKKLQDLILMI
jgi:hypothetical protein